MASKCVAVLASTFLGTIYPTLVAAIFVAVGMVMVGVTLRVPPYFGTGEADASPIIEGCADWTRVLESRANRMRCAMDMALLWTFVCMLAACLMQRDGDASSMMLRVLPACTVVFLATGYWLPSCVRGCRRREQVAVHMA